jgi:hypothetical protein
MNLRVEGLFFRHQDSLPTLEDAISAMVQEEIRLR